MGHVNQQISCRELLWDIARRAGSIPFERICTAIQRCGVPTYVSEEDEVSGFILYIFDNEPSVGSDCCVLHATSVHVLLMCC